MKLVVLPVIAIVLLSAAPSLAQRSGDDLWINVRDSDSKIIGPDDFSSVKARVDGSDVKLTDQDLIEMPVGVKSFVVATGCGIKLAQITFNFKGRSMILEVRNVSGDSGNILLDSVPFREGTYMIDLKRWDREGCETDASIVEPNSVRGGSEMCVIRPSRWKPVEPKPKA